MKPLVSRAQDFGNGSGSVKLFLASAFTLRSRSFKAFAVPHLCRHFRLRFFGYMLGFQVNALVANMILVRCNSYMPIS